MTILSHRCLYFLAIDEKSGIEKALVLGLQNFFGRFEHFFPSKAGAERMVIQQPKRKK